MLLHLVMHKIKLRILCCHSKPIKPIMKIMMSKWCLNELQMSQDSDAQDVEVEQKKQKKKKRKKVYFRPPTPRWWVLCSILTVLHFRRWRMWNWRNSSHDEQFSASITQEASIVCWLEERWMEGFGIEGKNWVNYSHGFFFLGILCATTCYFFDVSKVAKNGTLWSLQV